MNKWIVAASAIGGAVVIAAAATIGVNIVNHSSVPSPPEIVADVNTGSLVTLPTTCVHYAAGLSGWQYDDNGDAWLCTPSTSSTSPLSNNDNGCAYFAGTLQVDNWQNNCPKQTPTSAAAWQQDVSEVTGEQNAQAQAQEQAQQQAQADAQHQQWLNWCDGLGNLLQNRESHFSDTQAHLADAQQHLADMKAHPEYGQVVVDDAQQQVSDAQQQVQEAEQWVSDTTIDLFDGGCPQAALSIESPDNTTIVTTTGDTAQDDDQEIVSFIQWRESLGHYGWHPAGSMDNFAQTCTDQKSGVTLTVEDLTGTPKSPDLCKF